MSDPTGSGTSGNAGNDPSSLGTGRQPAQPPTRMRAGPVIALVLGSLLAVIGLGLVAGGATVAAANSRQQNNGYFTTSTERFTVESYALTSPPLDMMGDRGAPAGLPFDLGSIRLRATSATPGGSIFIGIAPQADVDRYLGQVHYTELTDLSLHPFTPEYRDVPGVRVPDAPADQAWWVESASGPGTQEITWNLQAGGAVPPGDWAVVVMNADAGPVVAVDLQAGARSDLLWPVAIALLVGGLVVLLIGAALIVVGAIGLRRGAPPRGPATPGLLGAPVVPVVPVAPGVPPDQAVPGVQAGPGAGSLAAPASPDKPRVYPARLEGAQDPALSRWLWLVKWVLIIPHVIVLFFLWVAFAVCTIIAGFGILFTARYPRALFDFNVGVLRWSWRVSFYAYSALGTDEYPPFTLERTDYPADFEIAYPERLSRGLVLVKWWLLAIPQLLIVAAFTGGAWMWRGDRGQGGTDTWPHTGASLLTLLVFFAAVILLFTGRYPRDLFALVMGLNRWIYRVITYTALFRDEYPPFRLDQGPVDPASRGPASIDPASGPASVGPPSAP